MQRIVERLSALDSPWCCPHGRPTLRYLATVGKPEKIASRPVVLN